MTRTRYLILLVSLSLALVLVVVLAAALSSEGEPSGPPQPIEAVSPVPGDVVTRQAVVEVDMPVGYRIDLDIDGRTVAEHELVVTEAIGMFRWRPAPGGAFADWEPGEHTVTVHWERTVGRPDVGSYTWGFRIV